MKHEQFSFLHTISAKISEDSSDRKIHRPKRKRKASNETATGGIINTCSINTKPVIAEDNDYDD